MLITIIIFRIKSLWYTPRNRDCWGRSCGCRCCDFLTKQVLSGCATWLIALFTCHNSDIFCFASSAVPNPRVRDWIARRAFPVTGGIAWNFFICTSSTFGLTTLAFRHRKIVSTLVAWLTSQRAMLWACSSSGAFAVWATTGFLYRTIHAEPGFNTRAAKAVSAKRLALATILTRRQSALVCRLLLEMA